ncbi:MAG TPA: trehalose-phosphatase [Polyangia bacterium]|nr:trehalose-phosphatase [Polyangia bacterium]
MRNILLPANHQVLLRLGRPDTLLVFDFDGTLAPLVADREQALMRDSTRMLFVRLCRLYPCAVISGRSRADVKRRLGGARVAQVVGNHGLEPSRNLAGFARQIRTAGPHLHKAIGHWQGIEIEDKRYSLTIHYRKARQKRGARAAIGAAIAQLPPGLRTVAGKLGVSVIPTPAPNKGSALLALRDRHNAAATLYIGDEQTDEDVFRLKQPGRARLVSVRVGHARGSAAGYFLRNQQAIDVLLERLVGLRDALRKAAPARSRRAGRR